MLCLKLYNDLILLHYHNTAKLLSEKYMQSVTNQKQNTTLTSLGASVVTIIANIMICKDCNK